MCRMAGVSAALAYHRREGALARYQQTRRYLSAQAPGAWSAGDDPLGWGQDRPTQPVDAAPARTPWQKPDSRGGGQQKCPDCLGAVDAPPGRSAGHGLRGTDKRPNDLKRVEDRYLSRALTWQTDRGVLPHHARCDRVDDTNGQTGFLPTA